MQDILDDIQDWLASGHGQIALATVVETWGSAPRKVGAKMAFTADGLITGSVSGGCVEGAVIEIGQDVLRSSVPQLLEFGVADETAWGVGLACGGRIAVFVEVLHPKAFEFALALVRSGGRGVMATVIAGSDALAGRRVLWDTAGLRHADLPDDIVKEVMAVASEFTVSGRISLADGTSLFVDVLQPPPALIMIGGAHIAVSLARLAKTVGYRTIVIDPRRAFGSVERFPDVDRLIQAWPAGALAELELNGETAVVTLSHDPKIDDPALAAALDSEAFYVGALGSRRTHAGRCERLRERGVAKVRLARIHAPVGLDIGADTPEEIALAIMAEVVQAYRRRMQVTS